MYSIYNLTPGFRNSQSFIQGELVLEIIELQSE